MDATMPNVVKMNRLQIALVEHRKSQVELEMSAQIVSSVKAKYNVTQSQLAELLGVDQSYISRVERGERNLTILHLEKLSECLNMPMAVCLWRVLGIPPALSAKKRQVFEEIEGLLKQAFPDSWEE